MPAKNKEEKIMVEYQGQKMTLKEACKQAGWCYQTIHYRIRKWKCTFEEALAKPLRRGQSRPETETELWCEACQMMHPKGEFGVERRAGSGFQSACKLVNNKRERAYVAAHRAEVNTRSSEFRRKKRSSLDSREYAIRLLIYGARQRARRKGITFNITPADIQAPDMCPVFGMRLVYGSTKRSTDTSASIDRIDSRKGYTPDNVWVISYKANRIKSDATLEELKAIVTALERLGEAHNGVEFELSCRLFECQEEI